MIDQTKPQRIELQNVGKQAKILINNHAGKTGKITGFKNGEYEIELLPYETATAPMTFNFPPNHIRVLDGDSHIGSLTGAGVAGELKKSDEVIVAPNDLQSIKRRAEHWQVPAGVSEQVKHDLLTLIGMIEASPAPVDELEVLRRRVAAVIKANADLDEKLVNVQSANATLSQQLEEEKRNRNNERQLRIQTLTEREKENEALKAELASARKTEVEALKMVEAERDEARRELEISRKQVQILAKKIRRDKKQPVEIKTLVHEFDAGENTSAIDAIFAEYKNEGWNVDHHTVNTVFDHTSRVTTHYRIATLSRPIKTTPQPPKRETATAAPMVVTGEVIPVSIPVPAYATPFNKAAMDAEVMANANAAVMAFRAERERHPPPRPFFLSAGV